MNNITQQEIALDLGVSHSAVSQWFSGTTTPKYHHAVRMHKKHKIHFLAWEDIKAFIEKNTKDAVVEDFNVSEEKEVKIFS